MFTFVFQSKANRETLRDFNNRLREFCAENPVVSVDATAFGPNLIIQGTTADDVDAEGVPTFTAVVRTLDPLDNDLEEQLDGLIGQELERHPKTEAEADEKDPNMPVKFVVCSGEKKSWVVLLCINGEAEDDSSGDEGGGGGDPEPTDAPLPAPAAGFQA
jgi:hypothetical protein